MIVKNHAEKHISEKLFLWVNNFIYFLLFIFALTFPINPYFGKQIVTAVFVLLFFILDYKKLLFIVKNNDIFKYISLFMIFIIFSYFWTDNVIAGKAIIRDLFKYWYIPTLTLICTIDKKNFKVLLTAFFLGMMINEVLSYLMYFFQLKSLLGFSFSHFYLVPFQASHMEYSIFLAMVSLLLGFYVIKEQNIFLRLCYFFSMISSCVILFLQEGRTGQVALIFTLLILIFIHYKQRIYFIFLSVLVLIIGIYFVYNYSSTFNKRVNVGVNDIRKVYKYNNFSSSLGVRLAAYNSLPTIIKETNFIIGAGIGDTRDIMTKINQKLYGNSFNQQKGRIHQTLITIFHALGIVGLAFFLLPLIYLLRLKVRLEDISYIRYSFIGVIFISMCTHDIFRQREILLLYAFFVALIVGFKIYDDDEEIIKKEIIYKL